jgi:nitroreductase
MDVRDAIEKRRAYRSLDPVEITDAMIEDLARAAGLSASCFNKQPWRFIFARDRDILDQLFSAMSRGNEWTQQASMIIAVFSEKALDCVVKGREYYLFDSGMASAFLILRATELGLVAHPIAGYDEGRAKEILHIPADMQLITLINVGRHSDEIHAQLSEEQAKVEKERPVRLPFEKYVFLDSFSEDDNG